MNKILQATALSTLLSLFPITSDAASKSLTDVKSLGNKLVEQQKLNVNTADVKQLTSIKGIGKKKAQAIVDYIEENGKLSSVDELVNVKGIGSKLVTKMSPYLTVE